MRPIYPSLLYTSSHAGLQAAGGRMHLHVEVVVILREGLMTTSPPPCAKD